MSETFDLIAACAFGLEAIVRRELEALGYSAKVLSPGRILFHGDASAICRANLWLRCADRILIRVASFEAMDFDALFDTTRDIDWTRWLPQDASFPVAGRSIKSQLSSVPAVQRAVKKATVLSLQKAYDTETLPETGAEHKIEISLLNDEATITLDTTGPSLHKRGYRMRAGDAPLKETLAAAMVMLSFWKRDRPLIDPFCGSGTIPIEAAMIARNLAPGRSRTFAANQWSFINRSLWDEAITEAKDLEQPQLELKIIGNDIDERSLAAARLNAIDADVEDSIHFQARAFEDLTSAKHFGCLITNPPYGQRLGEQRELEPLYQSIPLVLRKLPTWSHYVFTSYPQFERLIGRNADRRRKLYNGRIECMYYQFHGPKQVTRQEVTEPLTRDETSSSVATAVLESFSIDTLSLALGMPIMPLPSAEETELPPPAEGLPVSPSEVPSIPPSPYQQKPSVRPERMPSAFGELGPKAREQAELFRARLKKRARHLRRYPTKQGVTCYRLYERDVPELPFIIDRYDDHIHIVEYDRPHDRDIAQHANWLDLMVRTAAETLEIEKGKTFFKFKSRQSGSHQHEHVANEEYEIKVREGGLTFILNLSDYVDTGLFLDHRLTRDMVRKEAAGKSMLNLFAYTGSFSAYAADGGATETTTVDWSNTYIDWARRNMRQNDFTGPEHRFVRESAVDFVKDHPPGERYDLAVVDPPTFSNSKRTEEIWDVQRDHGELLYGLIQLMRPDGIIYFSSNFRRLKFDEQAIDASSVREITAQTVPPEYRNRRIHRCWRIVK